jgi:hypothetical protein
MTPGLLREAFDRAAAEELAHLFTNLVDGLVVATNDGSDTEADARAAFERGVGIVRRAYAIAADLAAEGGP